MIVFVHLLNDRSGSPQVLCSVIAALRLKQQRLRLFIGSDGSGCLDDVGIEIMRYWYKRTPYRLLTLVTYLYSQLELMIRLFCMRDIDRHALIYINTLLPFGAALYGWITRRRVVYHLHEVSISPVLLRWFLITIARHTAQSLIYVSNFHRDCLPIAGVPARTIHNALNKDFFLKATETSYSHRHNGIFRVLMLASLRNYKGIPECLALANWLTERRDIHFDLVLNDDERAIQHYFATKTVSPCVTIHSRTNDPSAYYAQASLVLNLSRPDLVMETFGLTLLEAMAFGVPVIVPPVGGPAELVCDGQEGFLIDCRNTNDLVKKVLQLADDKNLCFTLSAAARRRAAHFSSTAFAHALCEMLDIQKIEKTEV